MNSLIKSKIGDTVEAICDECKQPYTFKWAGRKRWFCEACAKKSKWASIKQNKDRYVRKPGELYASNSSYLDRIALCSHEEAAVRLAVIEALEQEANGATDVEVHVLSKQAVQQIERRAFSKIRRAIRPIWEEFKEDQPRGKVAEPSNLYQEFFDEGRENIRLAIVRSKS